MRLDRIYDVTWDKLKQITFGWITGFDRATANSRPVPADFVASSAILLLLICERFKVEPREVLTAAGRIIRHADDAAPLYTRTMRDFLKEELPND